MNAANDEFPDSRCERLWYARPVTCALLGGLVILLVPGRALAIQPSIVQEVRQKIEAKQYQDALHQISAALNRSEWGEDEDPDRYELLMLQGEGLLQTGQRMSAANSFGLAQQCALDARQAAMARAHVLLLKGCWNNQYKPKQGGAQPIDILDQQSRKAAFAALKEDQARAVHRDLESAMQAKTLPPMFKVLSPLLDVGSLEYASKGSAEETREQLQQLGGRARELIDGELRRIRREALALEMAANSMANDARRGLYTNERMKAQSMIDYLKQIEKTAREVRRRARELGFDGAAWEPIIADSADLSDRLQALLITPNY